MVNEVIHKKKVDGRWMIEHRKILKEVDEEMEELEEKKEMIKKKKSKKTNKR